MNFKGLIAASVAISMSATPALAAANGALTPAISVAPASETITGFAAEDGEDGDGGNVIVWILALIAAGVGLCILTNVCGDDDEDRPTSP